MKTRFVAKSHRLGFGKYRELTAEQVFQKDPKYIVWVKDNLKGIRFATGLSQRINKYKKAKQ